ncbi:MAG: ABC transporter ATP-binding protein, partial [Acidobacteriota bacterium]|nr:ABC transporter ATP-binding protein [Acidobacteriota bacterium]
IWALQDVCFELRKGEVLGIVGGNGAGKSTLLKVLSRITEPTRGGAEIHGRVGSLLEVGTGFHPELTGRENIYLNGAILGMSKAEIARKFDEIVAFAEIDRFVDTPVKRYSSGMYMRLAFAVAGHLETEILIIDEVLAVGDSAFQKKCLNKMDAVANQGRTVLFVSHNMTALQTLCTRAIWLGKGEVKADGLPHAVVSQYLHANANTMLTRVWEEMEPGAGNERVRLRSARILAANTQHITVADPIGIEVVFDNFIPGVALNVSLQIHTVEGVCIFATPSPSQRTPAGTVRMLCHIPDDLLNDGRYRVQIMIVQDESTIVLNWGEAMVFEIHDKPRQIAWFGKWPGVVRPELHWEVAIPEGADEAVGSERFTVA